jgi:hypothetical protein
MEAATLYPRRPKDTTSRKDSNMERAWIAVIQWVDGGPDDDPSTLNYDADELRVFAATEEAARSLAGQIWSATKGANWPHSRIEHIQVIPQSRLQTLAIG